MVPGAVLNSSIRHLAEDTAAGKHVARDREDQETLWRGPQVGVLEGPVEDGSVELRGLGERGTCD